MEKRYNAELNFKSTSINLYDVTKDEILLVLKRQVEDAYDVLLSIKWELVNNV